MTPAPVQCARCGVVYDGDGECGRCLREDQEGAAAPHAAHPWKQIGRSVHCESCDLRLYQGKLPASDRDKRSMALALAGIAAAVQGMPAPPPWNGDPALVKYWRELSAAFELADDAFAIGQRRAFYLHLREATRHVSALWLYLNGAGAPWDDGAALDPPESHGRRRSR